MSKLLKCPFCGGEAREYKQRFSFYGEAVDMACCDKCGFSLVKSVWNTRTPMANIVEKLEEETDFLKDCTKYGNKDAKQQEKSYSTMMMYEVASLVDYLIDIVKQEINNGLE